MNLSLNLSEAPNYSLAVLQDDGLNLRHVQKFQADNISLINGNLINFALMRGVVAMCCEDLMKQM